MRKPEGIVVHPESVTNDSRTGTLEIRWQDGAVQQLGNAFLRASCQCADCKTARIAGTLSAVPPETRITDIAAVGSYGIQLFFSDGHERGIYPWIYLRRLEDEAPAR